METSQSQSSESVFETFEPHCETHQSKTQRIAGCEASGRIGRCSGIHHGGGIQRVAGPDRRMRRVRLNPCDRSISRR
eukprot:1450664-Rhodomonas_salina.1